MAIPGIGDLHLRLSGDFRLVLRHGLTSSEQASLSGLFDAHPELEAVLVPTRERLTVKAVPAATCRLLTTIQEREQISVTDALPHLQGGREVARLVLDRILTIGPIEGAFLTGIRAGPVFNPSPPATAPETGIGRLSLQAIQYAETLDLDPDQIAVRLYRYNTTPSSAALHRRYPGSADVERFLDVEAMTSQYTTPESGLRLTRSDPYWFTWVRVPSGIMTQSCKLYVSPKLDSIREAMRCILSLPPRLLPESCKVGRQLPGLLRPDKLVLYFASHPAMLETAQELSDRLNGMEAHGVPFTAELSGGGLLSWGSDPPRTHQLHGWRDGERSWRSWMTNRLASSLVSARSPDPDSGTTPGQFALYRLALEGVDVTTWTLTDGWVT